MLYDSPPFVPGCDDCRAVPESRGADVAASLLFFFPQSAIERHALLAGEFPLWNRFSSLGTPLLGQGQSLIFDPLSWFTILDHGNSWGWDMKYILSKALFAIGIGWLVLLTSGSWQAASLLAVSSAFIGFFAFRNSHPAVFALTYAPWILYFWFVLIDAFRKERRCAAASPAFAALGLIAASVFQLNAGPPKEGIMTFLVVFGTGVLTLIFSNIRREYRFFVYILSAIIAAAIVLISAPYWVTFLDTLRQAKTQYDIPGASFIPIQYIITIFDPIFFEQIRDGALSLPSFNFFILIGVLSALAGVNRYYRDPYFLAAGFGGTLALAIAAGAIPASLIAKAPFIGNIIHIGNTFLVASMTPVLAFAGYGVSRFLTFKTERKLGYFPLLVTSVIGLGIVLFYYTVFTNNIHLFSPHASAFIVVIIAAASLTMVWVAKINTRYFLATLVFCFAILHIRHGMQLPTGVPQLDAHLFIPGEHADYSVSSAAIGVLKQQAGPFRAVGEGAILMPGFSASLGVESINSADALFSPYYRELMEALGLHGWGGGWARVVMAEDWERLGPLLDFLNVRYILTDRAREDAPAEATLVATTDLSLWSRNTAWPRAFFVDRQNSYRTVDDLASFVSARSGPFAAVENSSDAASPPAQDRVVVPADNYTLKFNSTSFDVDAPSSGAIVLLETYWEGGLEARVNGQSVKPYRADHIFIGLDIPKAGSYHVIVDYVPQHWRLSLLMAMAGLGVAGVAFKLGGAVRR